MRLTAQELEKMRGVNIGAVEADRLADVSGMAFDSSSLVSPITRSAAGGWALTFGFPKRI